MKLARRVFMIAGILLPQEGSRHLPRKVQEGVRHEILAIEECIGQILRQGETSIAALLHVVDPSAKATPAAGAQLPSQASAARSAA